MIKSQFKQRILAFSFIFPLIISAFSLLAMYAEAGSHHTHKSPPGLAIIFTLCLSLYFFYLSFKDFTRITIEDDGIALKNPFFRMRLLPAEIVSIDLYGKKIDNGRTRIVRNVIILQLVSGKKILLEDNLYSNIDEIKATLANNFSGRIVGQQKRAEFGGNN